MSTRFYYMPQDVWQVLRTLEWCHPDRDALIEFAGTGSRADDNWPEESKAYFAAFLNKHRRPHEKPLAKGT